MPRFIVLSSFTSDGWLELRKHPELTDLAADVASADGRIVEQSILIGDYDVLTVVDLPDPTNSHLLSLSRRATRVVLPAIEQQLFVRLMTQSAETCGPYKWQVSLPARAARLVLRPTAITNDIRRWFSSFTLIGGEYLKDLRGPVVIVSNHSSHLDFNAIFQALPRKYRNRLAIAAAADRFYLKGRKGYRKQGWWSSLAVNTFPLKRGGGRASLEYGEWLIQKGFSVAIFPEGGRPGGSKLGKFRVGPALLALATSVPVVPMYLEGLGAIRPKGSREHTPGPVTVRVGPAIRFAPGTDAQEATKELFHAVDALRLAANAGRPPRKFEPFEVSSGDGEANVASTADVKVSA